jgi:two-component system response regulator YesN
MLKVLLIDDEQYNIELLKQVIDWGKMGYEVAGSANNGSEGLNVYRASHPDVIIVDIKMPVMDGLEFIQAIRQQDALTKIIILSAYGEFEYAQKAIEYGINSYLLKPINEAKLINLLHTIRQEFPEAIPVNDLRILSDIVDNDHEVLIDEWKISEQMKFGKYPLVLEFIEHAFSHFLERKTRLDKVSMFCCSLVNLFKRELYKLNNEKGAAYFDSIRMEMEMVSSNKTYSDFKTRMVKAIMKAEVYFHEAMDRKDNFAVIFKAKEYALHHYMDEELSIQMVSDYVGLSKNHLSKIFKESTGENYWDYILKLKMEKAKELLGRTNKTNYDIAHDIGYNSEYHFSRIFSKMVGMSPSQYRRTAVR